MNRFIKALRSWEVSVAAWKVLKSFPDGYVLKHSVEKQEETCIKYKLLADIYAELFMESVKPDVYRSSINDYAARLTISISEDSRTLIVLRDGKIIYSHTKDYEEGN